ncbi:hypothetical protein K0M31_019098 [Melipona bicolor]|uniref:Uncharacterized protein n=1 Tax=Melipona bicolor TaxID=60889 RepID=A0AA40G275_9HYME|nr:hypothetical protein K0M31_019098 [Melipona bicolor]
MLCIHIEVGRFFSSSSFFLSTSDTQRRRKKARRRVTLDPCGKIQVEAADPGTLPTRRKVLLLLRHTGSRSGSGSVTERSKKD